MYTTYWWLKKKALNKGSAVPSLNLGQPTESEGPAENKLSSYLSSDSDLSTDDDEEEFLDVSISNAFNYRLLIVITFF